MELRQALQFVDHGRAATPAGGGLRRLDSGNHALHLGEGHPDGPPLRPLPARA